MSSRFVVLGSIIYILFFLALATMNAGPLVLAIPLTAYLGAAIWHNPPVATMSARHEIERDHARANSTVKVKLQVTNEGVDLEEVMIEDVLPARVTVVDGQTRMLASMASGETLTLEYSIKAPRGGYDWTMARITAGDHLGILRQKVELEARAKLIYLPDVPQLKKVSIRPPRTHGHSGPIPARRPGSGVDFFFLREYQLGDPRRWINWRTSARHEQLFVNQFEQERIADVGIILDARQQSNITQPRGNAIFEYSVNAAGALANAFLDDGNRVGLIVYGFGMERTFPGYGKIQKDRIRRSLGAARTGHNFALESLRYLPTRFFPAGSQIVMVSPLLAADLPAFTRLRAAGYEVLVVTPNPVDFEARGLGLYGELSWQIASVERALMLHKLQRLGVRVLDWDVEQPFEPLVRAALARPPMSRRSVVV